MHTGTCRSTGPYFSNILTLPERFALIHWPEEGTVTVVQDSKVDPYPPEKGDDCLVRAGSKKYRGRVMDVGKSVLSLCVNSELQLTSPITGGQRISIN